MHNPFEPKKSRNIVVSGVSSGIGNAICAELLSLGHCVIGLSRTAEKIGIADQRNYFPHTIDLSRLDELPKQFASIRQQHPSIDALICGAGRGQFGGLEEFSYDQIRSLVDLNFISHAFMSKAFLPALKTEIHSNIIFIGSEAALSGSRKGAVYCATKFALRGFAQSLRDEFSNSGIHVSIINPGATKTSFYEDLNFSHGDEASHYIETKEITEAVKLILNMRPGTVVDEINLSPLKKVIKSKATTKRRE